MDSGALSGAQTAGRLEKRVRWLTHVLAVALGGVFGWDVGLKMSGTWMGVVMAANSAFFASLAAGAAIDMWIRFRSGTHRRLGGHR